MKTLKYIVAFFCVITAPVWFLPAIVIHGIVTSTKDFYHIFLE